MLDNLSKVDCVRQLHLEIIETQAKCRLLQITYQTLLPANYRQWDAGISNGYN